MKKISYRLLLGVLAVLVLLSACNGGGSQKKVLVFSKTEGFRHQSIPDGVAMIEKLGEENNFAVVHTEDSEAINEENLKQFDAVVFLSTTGDILNARQQADFERYIQAGGGFVGIHAAADTEYDWPWYGGLVGGYFNGHPSNPNVRDAGIDLVEGSHPSTNMLPERWDRTDEWYNYKNLNSDMNILLNLDERSYEGGTNGESHPIAWYYEYDGGRTFYTGGGHTSEAFSEDLFVKHVLGGLQWAMSGDKKDYTQATTKRVPLENRFVQTIMAVNLDEPMELDVFPDGRVIVVERKGGIRMYNPETETTDSVTTFQVHTEFEDGLLGIAIDPNYEENNWIYMYYSPKEKVANRLSRFKFTDSLHFASEVNMLEVNTQRDECCHSGGSVEFGPDGLLYLSTGDDTNPFASDGFAPIDERPGRTAWDAQRSSANTNDLRGKILRIKPEADGSYSIPEGNLFAEGTENSRPEIYTMGLRNPFRISIDPKRNWLYWGDVGPDAGKTDSLRGPKGIDEINQARKAGNYGWPYFRGDTYVYNDYNFATKGHGEKFNPDKPINNSPNNTGLNELPPFQRPMIWYGYDESEEFPWLFTGGKNPMAGPVYYSDMYPDAKSAFPDYFDGTLLFYEWMRNWIYVVHLDEEGHFAKADPFMPNTKFSRPMDMVFGPDGSLYMLEYGQKWFARNMDARLSKIEYIKGNRAPIARILASQEVGGVPLTVEFSASASEDFDGDALTYAWKFPTETMKGESVSYTFEEAGQFWVELEVEDPTGASATAKKMIQVGNDVPTIAWSIDKGNQTFFWDDARFDYSVEVMDKEDGSLSEGDIQPDWVTVSINYLPEGDDITEIAQGHQMNTGAVATGSGEFATGKKLIDESDCKACHGINEKINGPSYAEVARRYRGEPGIVDKLANKIIKGGAGVWGETVMSAHPQVSMDQATQMVQYILSLSANKKSGSSLPVQGTYVASEHVGKGQGGQYVLMASYEDKGNAGIPPIVAQEQYILRSPMVSAESHDLSNAEHTNFQGSVVLGHEDYIGYSAIDMTGVKELVVMVGTRGDAPGAPEIQVRLDEPDGLLLGKAGFKNAEGGKALSIPIEEQTGKHNVYIVMQNETAPPQPFAGISSVYFGNGAGNFLSFR